MSGDKRDIGKPGRPDLSEGTAAPPGSTVSPGGHFEKPSEDPRKDSGLYELDENGELVLDDKGNPIPKSDRPK
jgi:hypothetical protein